MAEVLREPNYLEELLKILRSNVSAEELRDALFDYHENDIAEAIETLEPEERVHLYPLIGAELLADIFSYMDDKAVYFEELNVSEAAAVISEMDADDATEALGELEEQKKWEIVRLLSKDTRREIKLLESYEDEEIGSRMTTNCIIIRNDLSIRQAMRELVRQAGDNDNITTLYVEDENGVFYGAIDLPDLIIARDYMDLDDLISTSYPYVTDHELISECIERIREYEEASIPVLSNQGKILGILTSQEILEAVDDELGEDYAKLAGLSEEEDVKATTLDGIKKRIPWLIILLFLGMMVSSVVGIFENLVSLLPVLLCFQSLILGMAGNVGTQSLAVTIRVLMDESLTTKEKITHVGKELKIGVGNGLILGSVAVVLIGLYIHFFKSYPLTQALMISGCVGGSLLIAMACSSLVGTLIPMVFNRLNIDPAVASGPLITTVNDLIAVVTYYGLSWILLIETIHLA